MTDHLETATVLPYGRQAIDQEDIEAVTAVLRGDFLTTGPAVPKFEESLRAATGARHIAACSSGTAALHLAALALRLGPGDKVVVPAITFLATANAAIYVGADVVFADVDPDTGLMEARHLEAAIDASGGPVSAVFPVHLAGQCGDMEAISAVAEKTGARVVEDASHALGARHRGASLGACSYSDMATFSFHPVKTIASGEGGAVATRDPLLHERVCRLRNHGIEREPKKLRNAELATREGRPNPWYSEMAEPGFNYRLSDIHAALGASQLRKLAGFVARRRALVKRYQAALEPLAPKIRPIQRTPHCEPAWHLMVVLIEFDAAGIDRATLMARLRERGVGSQVHYIPVPWQPYYADNRNNGALHGAAEYYRRCLSLPLYPTMSDTDVDRVVEALSAALGD